VNPHLADRATERTRNRVSLATPALGPEELQEIQAAFAEGWITGGPRVARFGTALRSYLGVDNLVCTNSCSAGLTLALVELGVTAGDEVLNPAITFTACANVAVHRGALPVFVDVDPDTGLIDFDAARVAVTDRTKALVAVHLHGRPLDMEEVARFTADTGVPVIEDAAHAIGAHWRGRQIGSFGNATAFSFHASKNVTTADGGALVSVDAEAHARALIRSRQGMTRPSWERHEDDTPGLYDVVEPGFKFAMHDIAAAIGIHQLRRIETRIERHLELARLYDEALSDVPVRCLPGVPEHARHAMHVYAVLIPGGQTRRNRIARDLNDAGIGTSVHFRALHHHSYYARTSGLEPGALPAADAFSDSALSLPMHPQLTDDDVLHVADSLAAVLRR